jgi:hypothetical protein
MTDDFSTNFVKLEPAHCIKLCSPSTEEVIRLDKEGFHYKGQFIADAGEARRLMVKFLRQQTQPEPQGPTEDEWDALKDRLWGKYETIGYQGERFMYNGDFDTALDVARQELFRWGRPATAAKPVPVAERLPGPEDCAPWPDEPDANPWCWTGKEVDGGWEWNQIGLLGVDAKNLGRVLGGSGWTHWLPHHALPVPQQEGAND